MAQETGRENQDIEGIVEVSITGRALLDDPVLNKGSAFPEDERLELRLRLLALAEPCRISVVGDDPVIQQLGVDARSEA